MSKYPSPLILKEVGNINLPPVNHTGNLLINIRGSNGSGKTYTARSVASEFNLLSTFDKIVSTERSGEFKVKIYEYDKFFLVGSYKAACGGLDTVSDFYVISGIVKDLIKEKSVLMEGLLWSSVFSAQYRLDAELRALGHNVLWAGFDDTVETLINRVLDRRAEAGNHKPLPIENLVHKVYAVERGMNHAIHFTCNVLIGKHQDLHSNIVAALKGNSLAHIKFNTEHYAITDLQKWRDILKNDPKYTVEAGEERFNKFNTTNSLADLW